MKIEHLAKASIAIGSAVGQLRSGHRANPRWRFKPAVQGVKIAEATVASGEEATDDRVHS